MKKTTFVCFILLILFIQNIHSQELGDLYTEENAGFTMSKPQGWQTVDIGMRYLSIIGPLDNDITPNIGFVNDDYSGGERYDIIFDASVRTFSWVE